MYGCAAGSSRELSRSTAPLSHSEVAASLAPLGFDRATVYRNLVELSEARIIAGRARRPRVEI